MKNERTPDLSSEGKVKTNWNAIVCAMVAMATAATAWADLKHAIVGVVHVDDVERLEIQIQLQNQTLGLRMPKREDYMRRGGTGLVSPSLPSVAETTDGGVADEPASGSGPNPEQHPIVNRHASLSPVIPTSQDIEGIILPSGARP